MIEILMTLVKMIAPILSFTAEEIWEHLMETLRDQESVLLTDWYVMKKSISMKRLRKNGQRFKKLGKDAIKIIGKSKTRRKNRIIGNSWMPNYNVIRKYRFKDSFHKKIKQVLETALIVSQIEILTENRSIFGRRREERLYFAKSLSTLTEKNATDAGKYSTELGSVEGHPHICPRCSSVVE